MNDSGYRSSHLYNIIKLFIDSQGINRHAHAYNVNYK